MNQCVPDKTPHLPAIDTDIVKCLKSGKWRVKIQHPVYKVWVFLGTYLTPEEAKDACVRKKLEYESHSVQDPVAPLHTNVTDLEKCLGVKRIKSGKWVATISHNDVQVCLGTYNSAKEAAESYNLSKLELESQKLDCLRKFDETSTQQVTGHKRRASGSGSIYQVRTGKWKAEIEIRNVRHNLGLYASKEDAEEAISRKRCEADNEQSDVSRPKLAHAYQKKAGGRWRTEIRNPITKAKLHLGTFDTPEEAQEAYYSKRRDFDLMVSANKKPKLSNDSCENAEGLCTIKNLVYKSRSVQETAAPLHTYLAEFEVWLGTYNSPKEADDSFNALKPELDSRKIGCTRKVDAEDAINRKRGELGLKDDAEQSHGLITKAQEAYNRLMCEFDLTVCAHKPSNDRCEADAVVEGKSDSTCESDELLVSGDREELGLKNDAEQSNGLITKAQEAYNRLTCEFDLRVCAHKPSNDRCEADAVVEGGKSDSTCESDELLVSGDGSSVIEAGRNEENTGIVKNVDVETMPVFVTETMGLDFDMGIVNCYGELVGEYSRLDDELWLC